VRLLLPHIAGSDLRRVAHPQLVAQFAQQIHQPVTVAGGFHADQRGRRYLPVEPFRVARGLYQLLLPGLSRLRIQPTHLLPARMKITSYNHHVRRLLSFREALVLKPRLPDSIEPSLLSNQPLCPNVNARLCVEEQLFRADVEERLFRAASACAFDCGLQPRPALKGIHPPAVAAMNGRSSALTQALAPGAKKHPTGRNPGAAQIRGNHPCVSNTWRNKEMGQPQSVPAPEKMGQPAEGCEHWTPRSQGNGATEWCSRSRRFVHVGTAALGCPAPRSGGFGSRGLVAPPFSPGSPWVAGKKRSSARPKAERQVLSSAAQSNNGRADPPKREVFIFAMLWWPSGPPQANLRDI